MKKKLLLIGLLLWNLVSIGQVYHWTHDIKSEGFDEAFDLVVDPLGNVYVTGQIEYLTDFGNNIILESAGRHDIFVAKYDSTGALIWAKRAGGPGGDKAQSIAFDPNGFLYLVGEFEGIAMWDTISLSTQGIDINHMFIAKYDTSGNALWVHNIASADVVHTRGYGVSCDNLGNVYACGGIKGDVYYNGNYLFSSDGDYDGSLFKFDPDGNYIWGKRMGGGDSDKAYGVLADNNGYVYVTGYFAGTANFSPSYSLNGTGHTDIFLAKYDTAGDLTWAVQAGDTGFDRGWDIDMNVNRQIILTGESQYAHFGSHTITTRGYEDMFLAAYDSLGNNLWALSAGGEEDDIGRGVSHDLLGNIFVAGDFGGSSVFYPDTAYGNGFADVFIASYDAGGNALRWLRTSGGPDNDRGRGVGVDPAGNVYFCGEYVDSSLFDQTDLIGDSLLDIFVSKIAPGNYCSASLVAVSDVTCSGLCNGTAEATGQGQGNLTYSWSTVPASHSTYIDQLCAGSYSVTVTDVFGCVTTATAIIAEPSLLAINANVIHTTCVGCADGSLEATVSGGTPPYFYSWSNGSTDSLITGLIAGSYDLCLTDSNGCTLCNTFTVLDQPNGVADQSLNAMISYFPNPASDKLTVLNRTGVDVPLSIIDMIGRKVMTLNCSSSQCEFPLTSLSNGVYVIEFVTNEGKALRKQLTIAH